MNCASNQLTGQAGGHSQVVVSFIAAEAGALGNIESPVTDELALEAEIHRRAEVITSVLAGIMDEPASYRHWGLNE